MTAKSDITTELAESDAELRQAAAKFQRLRGYHKDELEPVRHVHPSLGDSLPSQAAIYGGMAVFEAVTRARALSKVDLDLPELMHWIYYDAKTRERVEAIHADRRIELHEEMLEREAEAEAPKGAAATR